MRNILKIELNPDRIYGLDILRALAILFVVAGHGIYLMPNAIVKYIEPFIFDGVSIFFVLSGFLIGGILIKLLKTNTINYKLIVNFWIRRWFRTLPNYFLILIVLLVLKYTFRDNVNVLDYKSYFIFSQNLFTEHPYFFPEAWSLSIEEWFYLLIPIVIFISIKVFKISINNSVLLAVFGIIIGVTLFRYFRFSRLPIVENSVWDGTFRKQVFTRLDSLMYGVIGAYIFYNSKNLWIKYRKPLLILGLLLFIFTKFNSFRTEQFGLYEFVFSFSVTSIATLLLLPYLSALSRGKGFIYKSLSYISLISYSMYLINLTLVQKVILATIDWSGIKNLNEYLFFSIRYAFYWILTVVISIIIYKYFEIPITNLRDRIRVK